MIAEVFETYGVAPVSEAALQQLEAYLDLLLFWNSRQNLTAIRDREGIVTRHFVESVFCAQSLPPIATVLDFGSGAGFPGLPIAIVRPEIRVTLAESQGKKAAFLREAVRTLGLSATVHAGRVETLASGIAFDCVTMRAVDKTLDMIPAAWNRVRHPGSLVLFSTTRSAEQLQQGLAVSNWTNTPIPGSLADGILLKATK